MFRQDHKNPVWVFVADIYVADNYDDSRVWTKIIVLMTVWELYRIILVMFMIPKSTHRDLSTAPTSQVRNVLCHIPSLH